MANDPVIVNIPQNTWVKVATSVKTGMIHKLTKKRAVYLQTYRLTGGAAPTLINEGVEIFEKSNSKDIGATVNIDVYIYCIDNDGSIRVDV